MKPPLGRAALVELLARVRQRQGLSIRRAAAAAGVAPSTVQGWFEGKHLPTPALTPNFLGLLATLGLIESDEDRDAWVNALAGMRGCTVIDEPPYVGLRAYRADEADLYRGRERSYAEVVRDCTRGDRAGLITVIVIGDSGAGKSSLLGAGLAGRAVAPGGPLEGLTVVWVEPAALPQFTAPQEPCLILVDQFEEAQKLPPAEQRAVFDALADLPDHATVVVALTADAFGFAMRDDRFSTHLDTHVRVASLTDKEYRRIIEEPATLHGRQISPALTSLILRDLHEYGEPTPGTVLPLLSSALRRCWVASTGETITTADYLRIGGLWSSLNDAAESVRASFAPEDQPLVRRLMLSLVRVDGNRILRRRIATSQLGDELRPIADAFVAARLLVEQDGQLSIAHDALLSRWERLRHWVDEESASLLIGRRIHMATQLWDEGGRSHEALMPVEAELWQAWSDAEGAPLLSALEREFIDASLAHAQANEASQRRTIRRIRSRQWAAMAASVLAVVMMISALVASARSKEFREQAEAATRSAQARQVALVANEVRAMTPNIAGQLSAAALELGEAVESRSAVVKSAGTLMPARATGPSGNTMLAAAPDGQLIARGDSSGTISLWRDGTLDGAPETFDSGGGQLFALRVIVLDGRVLALAGGQRTASIWDVTASPELLGEFGPDTTTYSVASHGTTILFGTLSGQIRRIDVADPDAPVELAPLEVSAEAATVGLAASDRGILAGGRPGMLEVFSTDGTPRSPLSIQGTALSISASPDGQEFLVGSTQGAATLLRADGDSLAQALTLELPGTIHSVAHAGERLYLAGAFGEVREYTHDGELLQSWPERTMAVSLSVQGSTLLVGATEGSTSLWDIDQRANILEVPEGVKLYNLIDGGDVVLVGSSTGAQILAPDGETWRPLPILTDSPDDELNPYFGLSGDGAVLVNQSTTTGALLTFERDGDAYREVHALPLERGLADILVSPRGRFLALGYRGEAGYDLFEREGEGWQLRAFVDGWPGGSAFSSDEGQFISMGVQGQDYNVWDITDVGQPRLLVNMTTTDDVVPIAFDYSPSGTLAVGDSAGDITLFDMSDPSSPSVTQRLRQARSSISQVSFSSDGARLLASTREGMVWLWRVDGDQVRLDLQLSPDDSAVQGVLAYRDWVLMSLSDGQVTAWPLDTESALSQICAKLGTRLSETEWERHVEGVPFTQGCR